MPTEHNPKTLYVKYHEEFNQIPDKPEYFMAFCKKYNVILSYKECRHLFQNPPVRANRSATQQSIHLSDQSDDDDDDDDETKESSNDDGGDTSEYDQNEALLESARSKLKSIGLAKYENKLGDDLMVNWETKWLELNMRELTDLGFNIEEARKFIEMVEEELW